MALYLVLETKKKHIFTFYRNIFWGCTKLWNEFQEIIIFN